MKNLSRSSLFIGLLCLALTTALQSCIDYYQYDDGYEYGKNALVTAKIADDQTFYLQLNDSVTMLPSNISKPPFGNKEVRALVQYYETEMYTPGYDKTIHVNWIDSILTKNTVKDLGSQNNAVYGNDPVDIVNDWVNIAEDCYLTLRFRTNWGPNGRPHEVNLVTGGNKYNPYVLEFRHNAHHNNSGKIGDALVAFNLKNLPSTEGKTVKLRLEWNSYNGKRCAEFDYRTH